MNCDDFILIVLIACNVIILVMIVIMQLSQCQSQWEVLNRFDSEEAAQVSGAAETVDYFG